MAGFEYLEQYSTFDSVAEMDEHVKLHLKQNDLTENERAIVFTLASRSLMYVGASHLKAETIADQVGVSTKTVYRAIKKLVELGIIRKVHTVRQKLSGRGANIYVILPCEVQEEAVAVETVEQPTQYMNEWQQMLYTFMNDLPLVQAVKDEMYKLVLASEINSVEAFHSAKDVIVNVARDIATGVLTVNKSIRSVFVGAYNARRKRKINKPSTISSVEEKQHSKRTVPFYNWLEERGNTCPEFFVPNRNTVFSPY